MGSITTNAKESGHITESGFPRVNLEALSLVKA